MNFFPNAFLSHLRIESLQFLQFGNNLRHPSTAGGLFFVFTVSHCQFIRGLLIVVCAFLKQTFVVWWVFG